MAKNLARQPLSSVAALVAPLVALAVTGCANPDQFLPSYEPGGPQGILGGTVTYQGPLPCTENSHVLGAAVFLAFQTDLLPPPEGLGTTAASLAALGGDDLFGGVVDQLTFNPDDLDDPAKSLWCPPDGTEVTVSGTWTIGPLPANEYEVRGFYDLHGQFDPAFKITTLPHQGDVAGGAIDNVSAVLMGAAPDYRRITLGEKPASGPCQVDGDCTSVTGAGSTCQTGYCMPPQGANIEGIDVTLGLPLPLGLPIFYPSHVIASTHACVNGTVTSVTPAPDDPTQLNLPCDYTLPVFSTSNPPGTEDSILRVQLTAGVAPSEVAAASASPFSFPVGPPAPTIAYSFQDLAGTGVFDITVDHTAASDIVPALYPLAIFSKLASPSDDLTAQATPVVILEGLTLYKSLVDTIFLTAPTINDIPPQTDVFVGITPAVICIDPTDQSPTATTTLLISHEKDCGDVDPLLSDQAGTIASLEKQFGRPVNLVQGCLPQGKYSMNLVYGTGQAWTDPNEAGVCAASELPVSANGTMCTGGVTTQGPTPRPRLPSQDLVLHIGPPGDPTYCVTNPTPAACCPAPTDKSPAVDPTTGQCKCPNTGTTTFACP
jgi:hypothetical protein